MRLLITPEALAGILDGTWIETDNTVAYILRTWDMMTPRPSGVTFLWRKKQLVDHLNFSYPRAGGESW